MMSMSLCLQATAALYQTMYEIYTTTVEKMWGQRYNTFPSILGCVALVVFDFAYKQHVFSFVLFCTSRVVVFSIQILHHPQLTTHPLHSPTKSTLTIPHTRYLSPRFFQMLHDSPAEFRRNLLFVVAFEPPKESARNQGLDEGQSQGQGQGQNPGEQVDDDANSLALGRVVAGTINLVKGTHFYGRYWGCFAFVKHLHFEACYYKAIEYCIEHGLTYMEVGRRWLLHIVYYLIMEADIITRHDHIWYPQYLTPFNPITPL